MAKKPVAQVPPSLPHRLMHSRTFWLYVASFVLAALVLSPILQSGFLSDDAINSAGFARSTMKAQGSSLAKVALEQQTAWVKNQGRFFPLTAYVYALFYVVDGNVVAFKAFIFALVMLDLGLFAYLVRRLSGSPAIAVMALLVAPIAIQFRSVTFHDPVLGFAGMLPVLVALILGSLILLAAYMERGGRTRLIGSLALYACGLLTYEISIAIFPLYFLIIWLYPKQHPVRKAAKMTIPFAGLAVGAAAIAVGLRLYFGRALTSSAAEFAKTAATGDMASGAYAPNFSLGAIAATIAKQVVASLPLSYRMLDSVSTSWMPGLGSDLFADSVLTVGILLAYVGIVGVVGLEVGREHTEGLRPRYGLILAVGIGIVVLPQVLIALSPRYQFEVYWGVGYLPVYAAYFGVAMIVAVAAYGFVRRAIGGGRVAHITALATVAALLAVAGVVNWGDNAAAVQIVNRRYLYPREIASVAVDRGLFEQVPSGATLLVDGQQAWDNTYFYDGASGRCADKVIALSDLATALPANATTTTASDGSSVYDLTSASTLFFVAKDGFWHENGIALCARVRRVSMRQGGASLELDPAYLYVAAAPKPAQQAKVFAKQPTQGLAAISPESAGFSSAAFTKLKSGPNWALFRTAEGQSIKVER